MTGIDRAEWSFLAKYLVKYGKKLIKILAADAVSSRIRRALRRFDRRPKERSGYDVLSSSFEEVAPIQADALRLLSRKPAGPAIA